jgi:hypothetical protein
MREVEIIARTDTPGFNGDEVEFRVFAAELAAALGISAGELVDAIESDEVNCREIEAENGQFIAEIQVFNKRCRLRIRNLM